jgi:hypothetical protein
MKLIILSLIAIFLFTGCANKLNEVDNEPINTVDSAYTKNSSFCNINEDCIARSILKDCPYICSCPEATNKYYQHKIINCPPPGPLPLCHRCRPVSGAKCENNVCVLEFSE